MNIWKNNNTLNKYRKSLPIEDRNIYTEWKKNYDYKNISEYKRRKFRNQLDTKDWAKKCDLLDPLSKSTKLTEAVKYKAPDSPYKKFKSDLARELTSKHFPIWSYDKVDKKVYRSPLAILHNGCYGYNDYVVFHSVGNDQLAIEPGYGNGIACYIVSEGKGEEYFQNTNPSIPSEGYKTDNNFYYQSPTWRVHSGGKAKYFLKEGLTRNQIADAIIECMKVSCPNRNFDDEWDQIIVDINDKIIELDAYIKEHSAKLEIDSSDSTWKDPWFRDKIKKNINSNKKRIKELTDALQDPDLSPEFLSSDPNTTIERKSRNWYGGTWTRSYDGKTNYWITAAWNEDTAIRQVKHSFSCSRREPTGCSREPDYLASSVRCTNKFTTVEEAKAWSDSHYAFLI